MRLSLVGVVALFLLLSACGGDNAVESAEAAAKALGCEDVEQDEVAGADETVTCSVDGDRYRIAWFADDDSRQTYRLSAENSKKALEKNGDVEHGEFPVVLGDNWGVECLDTSCDEVIDVLGGERI